MISIKNPLVMIGAAVVLVAGLGTWIYSSMQTEAVERLDDFLYENRLENALYYREASYNPLSGALTLEDVDLDAGIALAASGRQVDSVRLSETLDRVIIHNVTDPMKGAVEFQGLTMFTSPSDEDRERNFLYGPLEGVLATARVVGLREVPLDGALGFDYDADEDKLTVEARLNGKSLARIVARAELARVKSLVRDLRRNLEYGDVGEEGMVAELDEEDVRAAGHLDFRNLYLHIADRGYFEKTGTLIRLNEFSYKDWYQGRQKHGEIPTPLDNGTFKRLLGRNLNRESEQHLRQFWVNGGEIEINVEARRPLRIDRMVEDGEMSRFVEISAEA